MENIPRPLGRDNVSKITEVWLLGNWWEGLVRYPFLCSSGSLICETARDVRIPLAVSQTIDAIDQ